MGWHKSTQRPLYLSPRLAYTQTYFFSPPSAARARDHPSYHHTLPSLTPSKLPPNSISPLPPCDGHPPPRYDLHIAHDDLGGAQGSPHLPGGHGGGVPMTHPQDPHPAPPGWTPPWCHSRGCGPPATRAPVSPGGWAVPPCPKWVAPGPPWLGCPTPCGPTPTGVHLAPGGAHPPSRTPGTWNHDPPPGHTWAHGATPTQSGVKGMGGGWAPTQRWPCVPTLKYIAGQCVSRPRSPW